MSRYISERKLVIVLFVTAFTVFALAREDMKRSRLLPGQAAAATAGKVTPGEKRGGNSVIAAQP